MKKIFTLIGAMLLTMGLNAQTTLKILPFSIEPGESKTVTLDLDNFDFAAASFKCDIVLPAGLDFQKNSRGKVSLSFNAEADRTSLEYHSLTPQLQSDGSLRIVCYSSGAEEFLGNSGALVNIPLIADAAATTGKAEIQIINQEVTDATGMTVANPEAYISEVTIGTTGVKNIDGESVNKGDGKYLKAGKIIIKKGDKEYNAVGSKIK